VSHFEHYALLVSPTAASLGVNMTTVTKLGPDLQQSYDNARVTIDYGGCLIYKTLYDYRKTGLSLR